MDGPRFALGFTSGSHVAAEFVAGLVGLMGGPIARYIETVIPVRSGPNLAPARDEVVRIFLAKSTAPLLVAVDCDMAFDWSHIQALVALTEKAGVVGARYLGQTAMGQTIEESGYFRGGAFVPVEIGTEPTELIDVDCLGAGLLAIRREVLNDVARNGPGEPLPWFCETIREGCHVGEDYEFTLRAKEAGHRVALAARVRVPHMKTLAI